MRPAYCYTARARGGLACTRQCAVEGRRKCLSADWLVLSVLQRKEKRSMVFTTLREILIDLGIDEHAIREDAHLREDLELDSTETVEIALELKRRLGVEIKLESRQDPTLAQVCFMVEQAMGSNVS